MSRIKKILAALPLALLVAAKQRATLPLQPLGKILGGHTPYLLGIFANLGWFGFLSLFLGWLAAMGGASTGAHIFHAPIHQASHA